VATITLSVVFTFFPDGLIQCSEIREGDKVGSVLLTHTPEMSAYVGGVTRDCVKCAKNREQGPTWA
jgi:hypothetical protein